MGVLEYLDFKASEQLRLSNGLISLDIGLFHSAHLLERLIDLLDGKPKKLFFTDMERDAFVKIREAINEMPYLSRFDPSVSIPLVHDTPVKVTGAALQQWLVNFQEPKISPQRSFSHQKYSVVGRQILTISSGIRHFRHITEE